MILATLCGVQAPFLLPRKFFHNPVSCAVQCALTGSLYVDSLMFSLHQPRTQAHTLPMLNKEDTNW